MKMQITYAISLLLVPAHPPVLTSILSHPRFPLRALSLPLSSSSNQVSLLLASSLIYRFSVPARYNCTHGDNDSYSLV